MRLGSYLKSLNKPELDELKNHINADEEMAKIIDLLAKNRSLVQIADELNVSVPTISRRITAIQNKIRKGV